MTVQDRIYGKIEIKSHLIVDLIHSKPFQRLKHISQDGATHYIQPIRNVTRYEHSIGTWYLSARYKRPIEEQIASLLHDLPHTAFSHVIDFVMDDKNQEYHDKFTNQIILNSEIPDILKKHKIEIKKVLQKENYYLLDNKLPDISVDRWDYFMRDGFSVHLIPEETIQLFLNSINEKNEKFYFDDIRIASLFTILYLNCFRLLWNDPTSHGSYFILAEAIKLGFKKNIISEKDLFTTDKIVMDRLRNAKDKEINQYLRRLKPGKEFIYASKENADFYGGANKVRFVDPWVLIQGKMKHVSDIVPGIKHYFEEIKERYKTIGVKQIV